MNFCSNCSGALSQSEWPRRCPTCNTMFWRQIAPVAVALQPVWSHICDRRLLIGRRAIMPHLGAWALPGGFVEFGEKPEDAIVRELEEEMGIRSTVNRYLGSHTTIEGNLLLFFIMHDLTEKEVEQMWKPSLECDQYRIIIEAEELCFPSHTEWMARFLGPEYL